MGAEAAGIGERGGFGDPAPPAERVEVTDARARSRAAPLVDDQLVDPEAGSHSAWARLVAATAKPASARRGAAARAATSAVMSCDPGTRRADRRRGRARGTCAATRRPASRASVHGRRRSRGARAAVRSSAAHAVEPVRDPAVGPAAAPRRRATSVDRQADERRRRSGTGTSTSTKSPSSSSPTRTSAQPVAGRSTMSNGRLSSSSFARTTPSTRLPGSSSRRRRSGPLPRTGTRLVVGRRRERSERLVGRLERQRLALLARSAATARRARTAARRARGLGPPRSAPGGRVRRPPRRRRTDRAVQLVPPAVERPSDATRRTAGRPRGW